MRHRPAEPSLPARSSRVQARSRRSAHRPARARAGRLALSAMLSTLVASFVLAVPVVSGAESGTSSGVFTSFTSAPTTRGSSSDSPVVMGIDGGPMSSSFAGAAAAGTTAPGAEASADAPDTATAAPETTGAAPDPAPAPAPDPVVEVPVETPETSAAAPASVDEEEPEPALAPAPAPAEAPADSSTEGQVVALVNRERAANGCDPVVADEGLAAVARAHSADMRDQEYFDHINLAGLDPFDRAEEAGISARAENIAMGQPDAESVMAAWMKSPGHRANILDCSLTALGVGVAEGTDGPWWTQLFA